MTTLNYQQIYEEEISDNIRQSLELPDRFYELSHQHRMLIEELVDTGYRQAVEEVLDPEIMAETIALSAELGGQLYNFANMLSSYTSREETTGSSD